MSFYTALRCKKNDFASKSTFRSFSFSKPDEKDRVLWKKCLVILYKGNIAPTYSPLMSRKRNYVRACQAKPYPANTKHFYIVCATSAQRLRRWSNIVQMLCKCFVFARMHMDLTLNSRDECTKGCKHKQQGMNFLPGKVLDRKYRGRAYDKTKYSVMCTTSE